MAKWYFSRGSRHSSAGAVTTKPMPCYGEADFVAHIQVIGNAAELEVSRGKLLALVPELVEAAALCNGAVRFHGGLPSAARKALRKAEKVIRRAEKLLANEDAVTECIDCGRVTMIAGKRCGCDCWQRDNK